MTSTALLRMSISVMCMASSPLPGWLTSSDSRSTPSFLAQLGSRACSASMKAAMPPFRWAWATTCRASVVLPLASGPKISTTRPLGIPWPPRAMSSERLPVEMPAISPQCSAPRGMMAPSPYCFSIWATAFLSVGWSSIIEAAGDLSAASLPAAIVRLAIFLAMVFLLRGFELVVVTMVGLLGIGCGSPGGRPAPGIVNL